MVTAQPKTFIFDNYTTDNGLSDNSCNKMLQDSDSFIWIATNSGLNRFDGKDFVKFYSTGSHNSLPGNYIKDIVCLPRHRLAVATNSGLGILNTKTSTCESLPIPAADVLKTKTNTIISIITDKKGNLIAGTYTGVYVFNAALKLIFRHDAYKPGDIGKKILQFSPDLYLMPDGRVLIFAAGLIYVLNIEQKNLENIKDIRDHEFDLFEKWNGMPGVTHGGNAYGQFFFINFNGRIDSIFAVDILHQRASASALGFSVSIADQINWQSKILPVNNGLLCISTASHAGCYLMHYNTQTLKANLLNNILKGTYCFDIISDKNNRIWVSGEEGVFKQSFIKTAFNNTLTPVEISNSSSNAIVSFIHFHHKYFILQWNTGILVYDDSLNFIRNISFLKAGKDNYPWNITYYAKDTLLVTTQYGALLLNTTDYSLKKFWQPGMPMVIDSYGGTCPLIDSHHQLWMGVGAGNGVLRMNMLTHDWKYFSPKIANADFKLRYPLSIAEDRSGNLWMGSPEGITRWNQRKQTFDTLIDRLPGIGSISGEPNTFIIDTQNNLWIMEQDFVLIKWNLNTGKFLVFPRPSNILPFKTEFIYGPWQNRLWITGDEGLLSFDIKTAQYQFIKKSDGIFDNDIVGNLYFDTATQRLFAGFLDAFTWFNPDNMLKARKPVQPLITEIKQIGDSVSFIQDSSPVFSYKENTFAISFTGINYDDGQSNTYAYRLFEKAPAAFIDIGNQKTVTFASLRPGNYTFQVKATLSDGTTSSQPTSFTFSIAFPYYETWWFYSLCAVAFAAVLYILYRYRINQLLQLQNVRNSIADDLHDDIGSTLSSISIMSELAKQKSPEAASIINRISESAATIQENMGDIVWSVNPKNDGFENVVQRMNQFASEILNAKNIQLDFQANYPAVPLKLSMNQRKNFYLFFKEAINNAAKYSASEKLSVLINQTDHQIEMMIQDYGKGFDINNITPGNGMNTLKKRVAELHGNFKIHSVIHAGTTVTLKFKIT